MHNKPHTAEAKEKIRQAHKGKRHPNAAQKGQRRCPLGKLCPDGYEAIAGAPNRGSFAVSLVHDMKSSATNRGIGWHLDPIDVFWMIQEPCHYCGQEVCFPQTRNGLDRVNNDVDYCKDNVVACCWRCNYAKRDSTQSEFLEYLHRIAKRYA